MNPQPSKRPASLLALALLFAPLRVPAQDQEEAAAARFQKKLDALFAACQAEQKRLGMARGDVVYQKYPTPELKLTRPLRVTPGATAELVLPGQKAGTRILFEADELSVEKESSVGSEYRATVRASPSAGPGSAIMHVYAPVSCATDQRTVYVGGRYQWDLKGSNGWRIQVRTVDERLGGGQEPSLLCKADFSRAGEPKPFVTRDMVVTLPRLPERHYAFATPDQGASQPAIDQARLNQLVMKMTDARSSPEERVRAQKEMERMTGSVQAEAEKMMKGCSHLVLELGAAGAVKGEAQCEGDATIPVSGTMRLAGK